MNYNCSETPYVRAGWWIKEYCEWDMEWVTRYGPFEDWESADWWLGQHGYFDADYKIEYGA